MTFHPNLRRLGDAHTLLFLVGTDVPFLIALPSEEILDRMSEAPLDELHDGPIFLLTLPFVSYWTEEELERSEYEEVPYSRSWGYVRVDQIACVMPPGPKIQRAIDNAENLLLNAEGAR